MKQPQQQIPLHRPPEDATYPHLPPNIGDPYGGPPLGGEEYVDHTDLVGSYGSIIKDLTSPESILDNLRMKLAGLRRTDEGKVVRRKGGFALKPHVADEITSFVEGIVNQNTHFSNYDDNTVRETMDALNHSLNRYMMQAGKEIPLMQRTQIALTVLNVAQGSLGKAKDGHTSRWSKGGFTDTPQGRESGGGGGFLGWLMPGRRGG